MNGKKEPGDAEAEIKRLSRRSFLQAALVTGGAAGGLYAFNKYVPVEDETKTPLRRVLAFNEAVARHLFFSPANRAATFPRSAAREPVNNYKGETPLVDLSAWRLSLAGTNDGDKTLTLKDVQALPHVSETTELTCIEGWSTVVNWTGARFADFAKAYPPPPGTKYVSLLSEPEDYPDERYYVGLDIESALHAQTLLAWAMNDKPLTPEHGAPLRLVIPTKYGSKNIKLITKIAYAAERPADYWAEQGYDWYAGL